MKALLFTLSFCFSSPLLFGQGYFAPIGTKWYYMRYQFGPTPPNPWYAVVEVIDTATVDGKPCISIVGGDDCGQLPYTTYLYLEDGKVFFKHSGIAQFLPLYDFNAGVGKTFTTNELYGWQSAVFKVTAVETETVGAQTFKIQHIELDSGYVSWGNKVIQYAGSNGFLFPQSGVCDPELGGLLCFSNGSFGYPEYPCNIVSTTSIGIFKSFQIAPNPASEDLFVFFESSEKMQLPLQLLNPTGKVVFEKSVFVNAGQNQVEIDVRNIPSGLYFIAFGGKAIGKVVVE